jgi:putative transposase
VLQTPNPLILWRIPRRGAKVNPDTGKSKHGENRAFMDNNLQSCRICNTVVIRGCLKSSISLAKERASRLPLENLMLNRFYDTDLTDTAWKLAKSLLPVAWHGGRPRTTDIWAVVNAIFYLLRTGCQWRLLPHHFPPWGTVYYYFRSWENSGVWVLLHRAIYEQARVAAGCAGCPSVVMMDGQSVKTTERGGTRAVSTGISV